MKVNQLKAGVILSYATQFIHILTGLLYTPIMLRLLGQSEYGLYQLVSSVVSYLSLLSLGFSSGYIRFYSRYKSKDDDAGIAKLNGMFLVIFSAISLLCLVCGGVMVWYADIIFGNGLTADELRKAKILLAMMVFNLSLSFLKSVFTNNVTAHQKFVFHRTIELLHALFNPFLTLPLLIMGYGSVGMVAITTLLTVFTFTANLIFSLKKLKMKFSFRSFDFKLLKEMWLFTFFIFINMIVDQINLSVDKFLLGRMVGTVSVAVYGVAAQLNSMYTLFSTSISNVFTPKVNMIVVKGDNDVITKLFNKVGRVQFIVLALAITGFILFGKEFIYIWAGPGYENAYIVGLLLMLPITVPLIQNLGIEIQRAMNKHNVRSIVYLCIAVCNILISILLIKRWGEIGAAAGTALSLILGNIIFMNIYYHKKLGINIISFWKEIAKFIPAIAISIAVGFLIKSVFTLTNIVFLALAILIYCAVYIVVMWFMGINKNEKELILKPVRRIVAKLCKR